MINWPTLLGPREADVKPRDVCDQCAKATPAPAGSRPVTADHKGPTPPATWVVPVMRDPPSSCRRNDPWPRKTFVIPGEPGRRPSRRSQKQVEVDAAPNPVMPRTDHERATSTRAYGRSSNPSQRYQGRAGIRI
ncbi:hypothetical protein SGFS_100160 [Streptomyces graminofaciens]|uniref:Uncharacterized protein n=1 Tax=Streptomyces graminofaciens TaxID=68212 RepID=A0ABN5VZQ9_9ACTN|nr:hypothetical protein SGFS_100160 [Streptomyces graminofaciens]